MQKKSCDYTNNLSKDKLAPYPKASYAWFVVIILMFAYILSYVDRTILTLLVPNIKQDLGLSDTELSLLHGIAFAIFYTFLGFPLGRLADSKNRVGIIAVGITIWSLMTMLCGVAKNFTHLFLARMGVGVGEAALNPAAYSIITDYFPPNKLSRALSTYVMGTYLGMGVAYIIGGSVVKAITNLPDIELPIVGHIFSWQLAFFYVGIPGLLFLGLLKLIKEPIRRGRVNTDGKVKSVPLSDVVKFLSTNKKTLISHSLGFSCLALLVNGIALWTPTFFQRTYGLETAEAGIIYGCILLFFGGSGVYCGGWLADILQRKGRNDAVFMSALIFALCGIIPTIFSPLMPSANWAFILIAPMVFCTSAPWGLAVAAIQQITPNELRGQVSSVYLFTVNLIGIGLGPTLIALMTDFYFENPADLRYSMAIIAGIASVLAALSIYLGLKPFRESLQRANAWK